MFDEFDTALLCVNFFLPSVTRITHFYNELRVDALHPRSF